MASNPFLGELSAQLSARVARTVGATEAHDLSALGLDEVARRLQPPGAAEG